MVDDTFKPPNSPCSLGKSRPNSPNPKQIPLLFLTLRFGMFRSYVSCQWAPKNHADLGSSKGGRGRDCPLEFRPWHGNRVIWARHEPQTCCCQCLRLLHSSNRRNFGKGNVAHPQEFDCGYLRALRRLPTSSFKFYKSWTPFPLKGVILRSEKLNHIPSSTVAHEVQDLFQTHVSIQWHSTPRRRGCLRVDGRSASCFGLLYLPQPRLILCILAPNLRRRTQSHNTGSNSRNPDEVDPEGTPLPEKRFAYVTQRN